MKLFFFTDAVAMSARVFVSFKCFKSTLMFSSKTGTYLRGDPKGIPHRGYTQALLTDIKLA